MMAPLVRLNISAISETGELPQKEIQETHSWAITVPAAAEASNLAIGENWLADFALDMTSLFNF